MIPNELTSIEQRMQQKWHDLVMAEQQGASVQVLEYMYNAYIVAVEEYNRCVAHANSMEQVITQPLDKSPVSSAQQLAHTFPSLPQATAHVGHKHKKAS